MPSNWIVSSKRDTHPCVCVCVWECLTTLFSPSPFFSPPSLIAVVSPGPWMIYCSVFTSVLFMFMEHIRRALWRAPWCLAARLVSATIWPAHTHATGLTWPSRPSGHAIRFCHEGKKGTFGKIAQLFLSFDVLYADPDPCIMCWTGPLLGAPPLCQWVKGLWDVDDVQKRKVAFWLRIQIFELKF